MPTKTKAEPRVTLHPLAANILVTLEPEPERSTVVHVVKAREDTVRSGRVVSIGPEVTRVQAGQRVWASTLAGTEVGVGQVPQLLLPETSVVAILDE